MSERIDYEDFKKYDAMFIQLAISLANDYSSIYFMDLATDNYVEYGTRDGGTELEILSAGSDFFADVIIRCKEVVYKDDQELFLRRFRKDALLKALSENKAFTFNYRLCYEGKEPEYYNLKMVRSLGDDSHLIIGVRNINDAVRMENELKNSLENAIETANRDALTGVKSKYAYTQEMENILRQMKEEGLKEFGIAVFDVNDLKKINDTEGHKKGDEAICAASTMICHIFKHSPIYRVGGDEFVAILRGEDYVNRNVLLQELKAKVLENRSKNEVTLAGGISVYDPERDKNPTDVFERADYEMYRDKRSFKKLNA